MTCDPHASFLSNTVEWLARAVRRSAQARLHREIGHLDDHLLTDVGLQRIGNRIERLKPSPGEDGD